MAPGASAPWYQCPALSTGVAAAVPLVSSLSYLLLQILPLVGVLSLVALAFTCVQWLRTLLVSLAAKFSVLVGCEFFAPVATEDPAWRGARITRMMTWLVGSGASHHIVLHIVPDQDLLQIFVLFTIKPRINTANFSAKAG